MCLWTRATQTVWLHSWSTWVRIRPWLGEVPLLVVHPHGLKLPGKATSFLRDRADVRYASYPASRVSPRRLAAILIKAPAEMIATPWSLTLDPATIVTSDGSGLCREWFDDDEQHRPVVWIATPSERPEPPDAIARLDAWAETAVGLAARPPATLHRLE